MKNTQENDIIIFGFHFPHMGKSAGYDQITKFLPHKYVSAESLLFGNSLFDTFKKKINMFALEFKCFTQAKKYRLAHYIYPENHISFSIPKKSNTKYVATFHQPLEWFVKGKDQKQNIKDKILYKLRKKSFERLDGIIVLTRENINELKQMFPKAKIKFIPHGVHNYSKYFHSVEEKNTLEIVTIGSNYRDFKTLKGVLDFALENNKNWRFHLIGINKDWKKELGRHKLVKIYDYLEEDEYLNTIAKKHVNFLPLTKATANNAVLEAHSLGIPTIVGNLQSTYDYRLSTTYFYNSIDDIIKHLEYYEKMELNKFNEIKSKTLEESEQFYWEKVAEKTRDFYLEFFK